jgi:hypothetical protein
VIASVAALGLPGGIEGALRAHPHVEALLRELKARTAA